MNGNEGYKNDDDDCDVIKIKSDVIFEEYVKKKGGFFEQNPYLIHRKRFYLIFAEKIKKKKSY